MRAGIDGEGDLAAGSGGDVHALKADERVDGAALLRGLEVGFDDFVAAELAGVGDGDGCGERVAGLECVCRELDRAVLERGVAQAVAEAPERLAGEVAVGAVLHRVVGEWRNAVERGIEGDGQAAGGVVESGERARDRGAALDAGIPGFKNRSGVLVGPVQRHGAAALQHDDQRLAGGGERFQQFLLRRGQIEAGAVAAVEAVDLDAHLFAFELRREADEGHDDIGFFGAGDGFVELGLRRRFPLERDAAAGAVAGVRILEHELMRFGVGEVDGDGRDFGEVHHRRRGGRCAGRGFEVAHRGEIVSGAQACPRRSLCRRAAGDSSPSANRGSCRAGSRVKT